MYYLMCRYPDGSFYRWIDQEINDKADAIAHAEDEMARDEVIGTVDVVGSFALAAVVRRRGPMCSSDECDNRAEWYVTYRDESLRDFCSPCTELIVRHPKHVVRITRLAHS